MFFPLWGDMESQLIRPILTKPRVPEQRPPAAPTARVRVAKAPVPGGYFIQQGREVMRRKPLDTLPRRFPRVPNPKYERPRSGVGDPRTIKVKI